MKRMAFFFVAAALGATALGAQDAATEERLNKLAGKIEDLQAGQETLRKQVEALVKEMESLRDQIGKPNGSYASQEDAKRLTEAIKEVDRKRLQDAEKIQAELGRLAKTVTAPPPNRRPAPPTENPTPRKPDLPDKGFEYIVKKGENLSMIVQAYRENNIKVTTDQILKANPGLKPDKLQVGQKIFIPAPQP